jgi:hypothetical protein
MFKIVKITGSIIFRVTILSHTWYLYEKIIAIYFVYSEG